MGGKMTGALSRVDPAHAGNEGGGNPAAYQTAIEHHPSHEPFWVATFDDPVATFTFVLAIVTLCLLGANLLLWLSTRGALKLARDEFNATHRPKIVLRQAVPIDDDDGPALLYTLVNIGDAPATIDESWVLAEFYCRPTPRALRAAGHDDLGKTVFASGEARDFSLPIGEPVMALIMGLNIEAEHRQALGPIVNLDAFGDLYFAGAINYLDAAGNKRTSVFRRYWDRQRRGFFRSENPDQEYAD
jgi:hypothetical protein